MGEIEYEKYLMQVRKKLDDRKYDNYAVYKPLSKEYWSQKPKILFCNLETYEQKGKLIVDYNQFLDWYTAPTCFFTGKINYLLNKRFEGNDLQESDLKSLIYDEKNIYSYLKRLAYLNFRVTTNHEIPQNNDKIMREIEKNKDEVAGQILNMEPHIILVGGHVGKDCFNFLFNTDLSFDSSISMRGIRIFSVRHLSRVSYKYWLKKINQIYEACESFVSNL